MEDDYSQSEHSSASDNADTGELDNIFYKCDVEHKGMVQVSTLVHYLKENATSGSTEECQSGEIESLRCLLDPDNEDILIDKRTFGNAVLLWMESVYNNNNNESIKVSPEFPEEVNQTPFNCLKTRIGSLVGLTPNNSPKICLFNTSLSNFAARDSMLNHSIETTGLASGERQHLVLQDLDVGELLSQVETLQFQNKRLTDENVGLKEQLLIAEDTTTQLSQRIEQLNKDLKNHQATVEKLQELRCEYEDLKLNVTTIIEHKKELLQKIRHLEKDNSLLENSRLLLEGQVNTLAGELESTQKTKKKLQTSLTEQKKMLSEAESLAAAQESQLMEENAKVYELEKTMKDFNKVNEILRQEKTDLEKQLNHTQHELTSLRLKSEKINLNGTDDLEDVSSLNEEEFMPVMSLAPTASSTPFLSTKAFSLCFEIQDGIQDEPRLPTPLCAKELEEVVESNVSEDFDEDVIKSTYNLNKMTGPLEKNPLLQHVKGYGKGNPDSPVRSIEIPDSFVLSPQPEIFSSLPKKDVGGEYFEKLTYLANLKQAADKRNLVMKEKLRRLKEKNKTAQEQLELTQKKLDVEAHTKCDLEEKLKKMQEIIAGEKSEKEVIKQQLKDWKEAVNKLEKEIQESETQATQLQQEKSELENNVENLKSTNAELKDWYQKSEDDLAKLETKFKEVTSKHGEEIEKIYNLEDQVRKLHLDRQIEMKDLWKIVHDETNYTSNDMEELNTTELREKVSQEIENLRTELAKSQLALETLQTKALPQLTLHLSQTGRIDDDNCDNLSGNEKVESPLVEALTLDSFSKRSSVKKWGQPYLRDNFVSNDNGLPWDSQNNLRRSDSSSCPDFEDVAFNVKRLPKRSPASNKKGFLKRKTPHVGNVRYAAANISTGSSTSGVEISSTSTRSEKLLAKKNVLFVNSFNTPDNFSSSEDLPGDGLHLNNKSLSCQNTSNRLSYEGINQLSPITHKRTPSFKHAIERGPSGDSGISNPSQDQSNSNPDLLAAREEDLLPHESDLIKIGLYTEKNRAGVLLRHSKYKTSFYDKKYNYTSEKDEWNSYNDEYFEDSDYLYDLKAYNDIRDTNYPDQKPRMNRNRFDNNLRTVNNQFIDSNRRQADGTVGNRFHEDEEELPYSNYNNVDPVKYHVERNLSPNVPRRLSDLPESEEANSSMKSQDMPIPPPRRSKCKSHVAPDKHKRSEHDEYHKGNLKPTEKISSETNVNVLAHFRPSQLSDGHGDNRMNVNKFSSGFDNKVQGCIPVLQVNQQGFEADKTNVLHRETPPYRPPSDASKPYQDRHVASFSQPPPPYRKPFYGDTSPNQALRKNNSFENKTSHNNQMDNTSDNSNMMTVKCDANQFNVITSKCDETFMREGDYTVSKVESSVNSTINVDNDMLDKLAKENKDMPVSIPNMEPRRKSLELFQKQSHVDFTEAVQADISCARDMDKSTVQSNVDGASSTKLSSDASCAKTTDSGDERSKKSLSGLSKTKTFDESTHDQHQGDDKAAKDNSNKNVEALVLSKPGQRDENNELKKEPDVKDEILKALEDIKVNQPLPESPKSLKSAELAKVREENLAKKKLTSEYSKMPELTESQEDAGNQTSVLIPVQSKIKTTIQGGVCPSLTDKILSKWGLKRGLKDPLEGADTLTEQEVEDRYCNVVLAFKTDKQTLDQRVELQLRARDTTEQNIHDEMKGLQTALKNLEPFCNDMKSREIFAQIQKHVDVLNVSNDRLTSRCEMLGASKQEFRLSRAVDVLVKHVENLKRMYEKEHQELEETRKLLEENKILGSGIGDKMRVSHNGIGGNIASKGVRRRASVAVLRTSPVMEINQNLLQNSVKQLDPKGFFNSCTKLPSTSRADHSSLFPSSNYSFNRRRASVAVTSTSSDRSPSLMTPSFLNYRNNRNRISSMSSTSSEESGMSRSPRNSIIDDALCEIPEPHTAETRTGSYLASPCLSLVKSKPFNDDTKENADDFLKKDDETGGDSNNNNDNSNNNNNLINVDSGSIHNGLTNNSSGSLQSESIDEDSQSGLTDDRKLSMSHGTENNFINQRIKTLIERQDTIEGNILDEGDNFIEKIWQNLPELEELKLRLRYMIAGVVFFMGIMSLMLTLIPQSEASEKKQFQGRLWTAVGEILWPYISLHRNSPPPF